MPFSPETQQIIAEVERLSGRPVHVEEDAGLKTLAQVTPARGVSPAHFVRYQPGNPAIRRRIIWWLIHWVSWRDFSTKPRLAESANNWL